MPHDLNDLYYFAKVVECGGFAAAGRETGIPKSRLSRRIAELEERLQVRLLHRTTRKLALTEVGERYLQHCRNLLLEAEMAEQVIAEQASSRVAGCAFPHRWPWLRATWPTCCRGFSNDTRRSSWKSS